MNRRINSIDAVRGLCLLNIFVNHITLGALLELSPSKIALFDSADVFVLLAGLSAFLAYGPRGAGHDFAAARDRMWKRALTIYFANLGILAASFAIFFIGAAGAPPPNPALSPIDVMATAGAPNYLWNVVTLQQSIGWSMVLRVYVFLMIAAPLYVWLAGRRFWYPLVPAALVWAVSGHFAIASRDSLTGELLSMTLLPWQLVFAAGISLGAAIVQGVALPRSRTLSAAAILIAAGGTWLMVAGDRISPDIHLWLEARNHHFWTGASKSLQSPLRLLNLLALGYLVMAFAKAPLIRLLHGAKPENFLCRLGRRSLHVFAFGAIFALAVDQLIWNLIAADLLVQRSPAAIVLEAGLVAAGVLGMIRIASRAGRTVPVAGDRSKAGAAVVTPTGFEPVAY